MRTHIKTARQLVIGAAIFALAALLANPAQAQDGKQLFENNCKSCHAIGQKVVGPDLKDIHKRRDEAWIKSFISNSSKMVAEGDKQAVEVFEEYSKIPMPSFSGSIDEAGLTALVDYMKAESEAPAIAETPAETTPAAAAPAAPAFSLQTIPGPVLLIGLVVGFLVLLIFLMMGMLLLQLVPVLIKDKDEKAIESSASLQWLALLKGDTRALTGKAHDVLVSEHDYDGITEFDNDLPPWWKYSFYATILFSVVYLLHYHVFNTGQLSEAEYQTEMAHAALMQSAIADDPNAKTNFTMLTAEADLEAGKKMYMQNCAACHGQNGEGTVGPNLADEYWLHGGDVNDVFRSVKFGIPSKGMVAWNKKLSKEQILQISSFIMTLQGTNPANAKEPQGEKVEPKMAVK